MIDINNYSKQVDNILYKNERYSARDNGSVLRHPKQADKPRPTDNKWTFGKQNPKTGYMEISGGERVHRIVATGFLGKPPSQEHVVDHIDTNRANNRPENLRWVTKLENVLLNETTRKRIAYVCGSVENFLENPSKYRNQLATPNLAWMCTVTKEEADNCLAHLKKWNKIDNHQNMGNKIDKWIFTTPKKNSQDYYENNNLLDSLKQYPEVYNKKHNQQLADQDWSTLTYFCSLPDKITTTPLQDYFNNLQPGKIFGINKYSKYIVSKSALCHNCIVTITESDGIKPWCVMKITFDKIFHHSIIKTCFDPNGAEKYFTLAQGLEWTGEDSIDDYC